MMTALRCRQGRREAVAGELPTALSLVQHEQLVVATQHLRSVRAEFLDKLSEQQLRALADVWKAVGLAEAPDTGYGT